MHAGVAKRGYAKAAATTEAMAPSLGERTLALLRQATTPLSAAVLQVDKAAINAWLYREGTTADVRWAHAATASPPTFVIGEDSGAAPSAATRRRVVLGASDA